MRVSVQRPFGIIVLLSVCVTLTFIGQTMPYPVLAPWLTAQGLSLGSLGWLSFAFSLGNLIGAPVAGGLVDRWGRRPMLLIGLMTIVVTNAVVPLFDSFESIVVLRFLLGIGNAGTMPAAIAVAADISPEAHRAKWIGLVTGGISVGLIIGPTVGGILYDALGFAAPFYVSAVTAFVAFLLVVVLVPETRAATLTRQEQVHIGMLDVLRNPPRPLAVLALLLWVDFLWVFSWVATEPAMLKHLYGDLAYTATMFGTAVGVFGAATALVSMVAGGLSDRFGRFPMIAIGLLLNVSWYFGVAYVTDYPWMLAASIISGVGAGLVTPALSAAYVDMTDASHRGRVAALKEMIISIGGMGGPLFSVYMTERVAPTQLLVAAALLIAVTGLGAAGFALKRRGIGQMNPSSPRKD